MVKLLHKYFLGTGMLVVCALAIARTISTGYSMQECVVKVDSLLAHDTKKAIQNYGAVLVQERRSSSDIAELIKKKFAPIETVIIQIIPPGNVLITITAFSPHYKINELLLWTSGSNLVPRDIYKPQAYRNCPIVRVYDESDPQLSEILAQVLPVIPFDLFIASEITVKDVSSIMINYKDNFCVRCSVDTIPDDFMLAECMHIKKELFEENRGHCRRCQRWIADVRFRDQIIVQADRGE